MIGRCVSCKKIRIIKIYEALSQTLWGRGKRICKKCFHSNRLVFNLMDG